MTNDHDRDRCVFCGEPITRTATGLVHNDPDLDHDHDPGTLDELARRSNVTDRGQVEAPHRWTATVDAWNVSPWSPCAVCGNPFADAPLCRQGRTDGRHRGGRLAR